MVLSSRILALSYHPASPQLFIYNNNINSALLTFRPNLKTNLKCRSMPSDYDSSSSSPLDSDSPETNVSGYANSFTPLHIHHHLHILHTASVNCYIVWFLFKLIFVYHFFLLVQIIINILLRQSLVCSWLVGTYLIFPAIRNCCLRLRVWYPTSSECLVVYCVL